jgi:hypothetical protein
VEGLATLKADAHRWLEGPEYEALRLRLEATHAAAEAPYAFSQPTAPQ